ncbi:uncharacterized protein UHOD_11203 [Ustilago sp. UG-2017b]|nr:uncharacterized protein UHOD_11203 [Ustilago sp. UG-2017b]
MPIHHVPRENGKNQCFRSQPGNQETITVIECIGAQGTKPPPMVIFWGKNHMQGWYCNHTAAKDWVFATSQNGWTDNELALHWLKDCFDKHTKQRAQGKYQLLILDGHDSHITAEFIQQAWDSPHCHYKHLSITSLQRHWNQLKAPPREGSMAHAQLPSRINTVTGMNRSPAVKETPTPSTPEEAKKLLAQMYAIMDQDQEEQQALLASNHRQGRIWMKKVGKFMDLLFGQHAIDQARIQELTAAHSKKQHALPGNRNQLSQARVLHQSGLPRLLAAREEQAQKDSGTRTRKGKKQAKGKEQASNQENLPVQLTPTLSSERSFWPLQSMLPFPGYESMSMVPPPLPFASSSTLPDEPPLPRWQPMPPFLPPMPPFM